MNRIFIRKPWKKMYFTTKWPYRKINPFLKQKNTIYQAEKFSPCSRNCSCMCFRKHTEYKTQIDKKFIRH